MKKEKIGIYDGEICNRNGCNGTIEEHPVENCSCHINPPCGQCTAPRNYCNKCDWDESEDTIPISEYGGSIWKPQPPRELDPAKINWNVFSTGTSCTMIKRGTYPPGTTIGELRKEVNGTFGGRFNYMENGKFEFVAYTD